MATMDIFNSDAFSMQSLTGAFNRVPYQPGLLGSIPGLIDDAPVRTEIISIEERNGVLSIIPTTQRGAPLPQRTRELRNIRHFNTVRVAKQDRIHAHEIQSIRAFGSETELMQVQAEVLRRYDGPTGLRRDLEVTWENMRLGMIQGIVLDADGTTINNWFTEWSISQPSEVDFVLGTATTDVRGKCSQVVRAMAKAAGGSWIEGQTQVHALAGDTFYDKFVAHAMVRDTFLNWSAATDLRQGMAYSAFTFGGITWHNYRGADNYDSGASEGIEMLGVAPTKAKFFPVNAPGVFKRALSPAETFDYVNTLGLPQYGMIVPDRDRNMWVDIEVYSYPLFICTRPGMLQRATTSN